MSILRAAEKRGFHVTQIGSSRHFYLRREDLIQADTEPLDSAEKSPNQIIVGDVVMLKSGGTTMTVMATTTAFAAIDGPTISCGWFDDHGVLHFEDFPLATICKRYGDRSNEPKNSDSE